MICLRFHPSALLTLLIPLLGVLTVGQTVFLWSCAALHELGHIFAYRLCGSGFESVTVLPFGLSAVPKSPLRLSPKNEIFCAAFGPAVNLLIVSFLMAMPTTFASLTVHYILYCNLCLLAVNLLPILPLDGGRILYYALACRYDLPVCETVCRRCAWIILCLLLFPVCITLFQDKNPSLALIWGYLTLYNGIQRGSI